LADAHLASQTPESIKNAGVTGGLDRARAESILDNERLNTNIKGTQKDAFNHIAGRP
jgi:hypothetical protein